jgi:N6-L-threonylcarbamoyladenine synthase
VILAIETSCDDTGVALYDGERIHAEITYRQAIHATYGGVIPEWASREHEVRLPQAIREIFSHAQITWEDLRAVAAAQGPGLLGSLLVGYTFAKAIAASSNIPLIGVHHLEAHIASLYLGHEAPLYPFVALVATGGHTHLYLVESPLTYHLVGKTQDDAVGEAFDKIAAWLGLPYPGGPEIENLAQKGNPHAYTFPTPRTEGRWDFSFSGLKSTFLQVRAAHPELTIEDLCASWQERVFRYLTEKAVAYAREAGVPRIALVGGVAANARLRTLWQEGARAANLQAYIAPLRYTMDNAAMIAVAGWHRYVNGLYTPILSAPFARG